MYEMKDFSINSKVWVYPISRTINSEQLAIVKQGLAEFIGQDGLGQWKAHGVPVKGAFQIVENRFVVITDDANSASATGCSIDSMLKIVCEALESAGTELADFSNIFFKLNDNIYEASRPDFAKMRSSGQIQNDTEVFNLAPANLGDFLDNGLSRPYQESWHKKVFE